MGSTKNVKKAHLGSISAEEQAEGPCCKHQLWDGGKQKRFLTPVCSHILSCKHEKTQHSLAYGSQMGLGEEVNWH